MLSIAEALEQIMPAFAPCGEVRATLEEALGLFLTGEARAREDLPPFDNSAMDGWAVRVGDLAAVPVALPAAGESRAGGPLPPALRAGTAMRIFTGAPVPEGADAVVMQEETERDGERVRFARTPSAGANIRRRASDLAAGAPMLGPETPLGPGELALLASQGIAAVAVHRRPVVAILSTGDELRDVSDPPVPGSIVNSNALALAAQVRQAGALPRVLPIARDRIDDITARVRDGLTADVLVTSGGVSVGEHDLVQRAFEEAGIRLAFWKVSMKPGKPLSFGRAGSVPVVGLPGNPVSAMVTFEVFVRPGLRRMLGDPRPYPRTATVEIEGALSRSPGRTELARAILRCEGDRLLARFHPLQGSGSLPSMVGVDALVVIPADRTRVEAGERLTALLLSDRAGSDRSPFCSITPDATSTGKL